MPAKKKPNRVYKRTRVIIKIERTGYPTRYYDGKRIETHPGWYGDIDKSKATVFYTKKAANLIVNRMIDALAKNAQIGWQESMGRGGGFSEEEREAEETTITIENL